MQKHCVTRWILVIALLVAPWALDAQQMRTVTGTVTVEDTGQPFPGVRVGIKGTQLFTVTDNNGNFSLPVPASAQELVFTYLGYRAQERPIDDRVDVSMARLAIGLEGIVVTAMGFEREKRSLGTAVQELSGDDLAAVPEQNIVNSLQGVASGVKVTNAGPTGGSARIVIRGSSSISGNNQPLFIVDGIPMDNSAPRNSGYGGIDWGNAIQDIDPTNVAQISVLKGPAAAALYGARAANGAVVITTKGGRDAPSNSLGVTASFTYTTENPLRLPNYQNEYGQGIDGEFQWVDGQGGGLWDFVDESWGPKLDGRLIDQFTGPSQPWIAHPDNVRSFFRTGQTLNANVAISRMSENSNVRLSISRSKQEGMDPANSIERLGVTLKGGANITDRLSTDASFNYVLNDRNNLPGTGYDEDNPMQSFIWFGRQVDMDALRDYTCDGDEPTPCIKGGQYNWNYNYHNNPFWEAFVNTNEARRDRLFGYLNMSYQLNDWMTLTGRAGQDLYREHQKQVTAPNSLDDAGFGSFNENTAFRSELNADLILNATRQPTPDITLDMTFGTNLRRNILESNNIAVSRLTAPGIYTIDNAAVTPTPTDFMSEKEVRSLYGAFSFNYAGYWNVDLTGRNDWSSTLPSDSNAYFYPSVSTAFVFTDAANLQSSILSSGKIRAGWTRVGNDADPYQLASVYGAQTAWGSAPMFAVPNTLANAGLKPEETTAWEVGADIGLLDERLGFVLTHYNRITRNQIMGVEISRTSGFSNQVLNAGEVLNKGWELLLTANPINSSSGFNWDVTVNWSQNQSEVTELYGDLETLVLGSYWSLNIEARKGEPYGVMYGNGYLRCTGAADPDLPGCGADDAGKLVLTAGGMPRRDPVRRILGNYNPDWTGGIQNRFRYGNVDLSVLVDGQMGGDVFSVTNWFGEYAGVLESTLRGRENDFCDPGIVVEGVLPDGTDNTSVTVCPESYFGRNYGIQEASIDDASFIKLREIRIGYQLPTEWANALGFSGANFALIGRNLALWSKIENIDPETAFDASNIQGIEFGQFPTARSIGFSLSLR
ncbi:MAG: SusC/RagA family TonB-linked outer membrane protein [Gemmatimonadota bacterium]|nr:SusC/RagA family TonB-linked outer membrane protein [Gemmatimonadota bacterium]